MSRPDLTALRTELLLAGVAPRHVHRAVCELGDHFDDLVDEQVQTGCDIHEAEQNALRSLGEFSAISAAMQLQPQLKSWAWRHPRLALLFYPVACVVALPAVPIRAGVENAATLGRWAACLLLGGFLTAFLFLALQLAISPKF